MDARKIEIPERILTRIDWCVKYSPYPLFEVVTEVMCQWGDRQFSHITDKAAKSEQCAILRARLNAIVERTAGRFKSIDKGVWWCDVCHNKILSRRCLKCDLRASGQRRKDAVRLQKFTEPQPEDAREPTDAPPGSLEKIKVMRLRNELGQCIFHPLDSMEIANSQRIEPRIELETSDEDLGDYDMEDDCDF